MDFSQKLATKLLSSTESFPVDFDNAWRWIGYSSKQKAKNKLFNHFELGIDFLTKRLKTPSGGRPSEIINLTIDCFKSLGMMAGTQQGTKIRRYFLECERIAKQALQTIPTQSEEIEKLKLQLELAKTQEKLLSATSALATMHSVEMVALVLGNPDAVITQVKEVPTVVTVDDKGQAIAQFDGIGITALAKRYGFGNNTKSCRKWLESVGITDEQWLSEPALIKSKKLPRQMLTWLDKQFANKKGIRQTIIGESFFDQ